MPEQEEWRAIGPLYEVSNLGRVRSVDRFILGTDDRKEFHHGRILKPWSLPGKAKYLVVSINTGTGRKKRTVHSLVAEAFLGPRPEGFDVMHLDGDRTNNRAENLQYGTRSENLRSTYAYGGRCANGKLTKTDALEIKRRLKSGESPRKIASDFGVNNAAIYHIKNGTAFGWLSEEVI